MLVVTDDVVDDEDDDDDGEVQRSEHMRVVAAD